MKAKFFFLGLCALALAACSIDEVSQMNDSNAIQFKATTATRAASTTTNNIESFSVWAWNTVDGTTSSTPFMDDVVAKKSGSVFTTSPLYFWPTGTVDFYAISPATTLTADDGSGNECAYIGGSLDTGGDYWKYTGNVARATIKGCGDITIEADLPSSAEDHVDICYAANTQQSSGSVAMNFRHAFSQLVFKAKNTNSEMDIDIQGVSVCSVNKHGVYTLPAFSGGGGTSTHLDDPSLGTSSISDSQGSWSVTESTQTRFVAGITPQTLVGTETGTVTLTTEDTGYLFVIPQQVDAWDPDNDNTDANLGSYIRILCNITEDGSQLWPNSVALAEKDDLVAQGAFVTIDEVDYAEIAVPVEVDWEEGYSYTYTLVFGSGAGYYPPDDPNTSVDGTPVLVPITFEVTVDEFQDADNKYVSTNPDAVTVNSLDDLKSAIESGASDITVTAKSAITLNDEYLDFTSDCTLTLEEGAVITATNSTGTNYPSINGYNGYTAAICVTSGTLTINGEGSVVTTGGSEAKGTEGIWVNGGAVIINGGTYKGGSWNIDEEGSESAVFVEYGAAYIYGGTFSSGKWKTSGDLYYVLNCMDTPRRDGLAWIYVYGGSYYMFDPSNCNSEGSDTNFVVDGYSVTENSPEENWYTVTESD